MPSTRKLSDLYGVLGTKSQKFCLETFHAVKTISLKVQILGDSCRLNMLDAMTKKTKQFSNSQALSITFAVFRMLLPWAFRLPMKIV